MIFIGENFATNMILANELFFLTQILHFSIAKAGVLMGLSAAAAVCGSLSATWFISRYSTSAIILAFMAIITLGTGTLLTAYWVPVFGILVGRSLLMASRAVIIVAMFTYRQRAIPQEYLSRVVAIQRTCAYSAIPVSAVVGGFLLSRSNDMRPVLFFATAVMTVFTFLGLISPLNSRRTKLPNLECGACPQIQAKAVD
jgi:predicted MFS family arabinose efflux permease